jgi:hypothetical protein
MQTAKDFLDNFIGKCYFDKSVNSYYTEAMIEFAKLHVQEALKAADEKAKTTVVDYEYELETPTPIWGVDSDSILNAYPLDKIK